MKRLLLVVLLVTLCIPSFAQYKDKQERLVDKGVEYNQFDTLLKYTNVALSTTVCITPSDATSTGTAAVYYLPDTVTYPILLKVQNLSANDVWYMPYATNATGASIPTATASVALTPVSTVAKSGLAFEKIFYTAPTLTFAASAASNVTIEVWGRNGDQ